MPDPVLGMEHLGSSSESAGPEPSPSEPHGVMCKIIITETGRSRKSRAESFACPHPTPLPLALPLPLPAPPPPPPPPQPSAAVKIAPLPASLEKTEQGRKVQEKAAGDKDHPKTTAPLQSGKTNAPRKVVQIPHIYGRTPQTLAQLKAPKKTQAQQKSTPIPVTKDRDTEKNAASKSDKQENPAVLNDRDGRSSDGNKKATSRRVTSTGQNGLPERVKGANVDRDESQTSAAKMRESRTNSPLRNVRFMIGESRRTRSTTSSSSTSSDDSFIDPHPYNIHTHPDLTGKQSESTPSSRNMVPSYVANLEETDSVESDDSSNIDAGETLGSRMPWEHTESISNPGPAQSQTHNMRGDRSLRNSKAASSISHAAQHDHVSAPTQSPTSSPYQLMPEQEWEPVSDQESAVDLGLLNQTPMTEQQIRNWDQMQDQSSGEKRGFDAWLKSLVASQHGRTSSAQPKPKRSKDPIFVYQTKSKPLARTGKEPLLVIKKSPRSDKSHQTSKAGHAQSESEKVKEPENKVETQNLSDRLPSAVRVAEQPVHYNPGLQIFWRDV